MHGAGPVRPLADEFDQWLERVTATHAAVRFTCTSRLHGDAEAAGQVAVQVVAGLIARPAVFRYFGLPYSGRIARLAERLLVDAADGRLVAVCSWSRLRGDLGHIPDQHRNVLVLTCVRGVDTEALAGHLGCDHAAAEAHQAAMLAYMRRLAGPGLAAEPISPGVTKE